MNNLKFLKIVHHFQLERIKAQINDGSTGAGSGAGSGGGRGGGRVETEAEEEVDAEVSFR